MLGNYLYARVHELGAELSFYVEGDGRVSIEQNEASRFELLRDQAEMIESRTSAQLPPPGT